MTWATSCTGCQMASDRSRPAPSGLRSARSTSASAFTSAASDEADEHVSEDAPGRLLAAPRRRARRGGAGRPVGRARVEVGAHQNWK